MSDTGLIYAVICGAAQGFSWAAAGVCLERLLTGRNDRISKKARLTIFFLFGFLFVQVKCVFLLPALAVSAGSAITQILFYILFLKYCYGDKGVVKFVHVAMLIIQNVLADVIWNALIGGVKVEVWEWPYRHRSMAEACVEIAILSVLLNLGYTVLVIKIQKKRRVKISPVWIASMLFIALLFLAMWMLHGMMVSHEFLGWYFAFLGVNLILIFGTMMLILSGSEKQEAQNEKQEAKEEARKLQQAMELEKVRYEQIEARREEMAKLRHDYNNVITSVMYLIENGKTDEARKIMKDLSERINKTGE